MTSDRFSDLIMQLTLMSCSNPPLSYMPGTTSIGRNCGQWPLRDNLKKLTKLILLLSLYKNRLKTVLRSWI